MIQRLVLFIFLLSLCSSLSAQEPISVKLVTRDPVLLGDTLSPEFAGGKSALYKYLSDNIEYPQVLIKIKMEGSLSLKFKVNKNGQVGDIEIIRGFDPDADDEVLRVVRMMPDWIPASVHGVSVDFVQFITVTFTITEALLEEAKHPKENSPIPSDSPAVTIPLDSLHIEKEVFEPVIDSLNTDPQYPGGKEALEAYLKTNMKYPKRALEYRITGRVIFNIEVSSDGEISKIWLFKGLFPDCNEEAFYLIKKMPKWIPGLKEGKPVAKQIMLPIPFELP